MTLAGFLPPSSNKSGSALVKATIKVADLKKIKPIKEQTTISAIAKSFKKSDISSKSGALVKTEKGGALVRSDEDLPEEQVIKVKIKILKLRDIFKDRYVYDKRKKNKERLEKNREEKEEREKELKGKKKSNKFNLGKFGALMPKTGIFDWITNFLLYTILGYLNNRFDILPKLLGLIPLLSKTMDFIVNIGGFLLNGLATFIDFGYGLVDKTRGFIKAIGGEGAGKIFDKFLGVLNNVLNLAFIAAMINAGGGFGKGKKGGKPGGKPRGRPGTGGRPKVTTSGGKGAGRPDIRNPLRTKPKVTTSGGGRTGRPDIRNPLRPKPKVTTAKPGGFRMPGMPKISPGSIAKGGASLGIGIALEAGVDAAFGALRTKTAQDAANKINTYSPERRAKAIAKMQEELKKEKDYQASPFHAIDKGIKFGGATHSENTSEYIRTMLETLGETPKYASGGLLGKSSGELPMLGGILSLPAIPKQKLPNLLPNLVGGVVGGFGKFFEMVGGLFGGKKADPNNPPVYIKGLINIGNKVKDVPLIGGSMYAAIQLALGMKVNRNVLDVVGAQLTNFSNLDAFKGISTSVSKLTSTLRFAQGGQIPSTVVSLTSSDNKKSVTSLSSFLDREIKSIELELDEEKEETDLPPSKDKDGDGTSEGDTGPGGSEGGIVGTGISKAVSVSKKLIADLGITPAQASGIVGNFLYESAGMNPAEKEGEPYGVPEKPWPLGTIGRGYGWAQWTNSAPGDRLDKFLKSYGGDKGKIATDDDNYRFLMKELKGSESLTRKGMVTGTYFPKDDPQAASDWFRQNWERAGIPADEKRRKETLAVFNKIKGLSRDKAKEEVAKSGGKIYTESAPDTSGGKEVPKGSIVQWLHGNPNRKGYDSGHAGETNAHDHFSFKSRGAAVNAFKTLKSSGYKPYEFEGFTSVGKHSASGGHYGAVGGPPTYSDTTDGTAFDIPWGTYGTGPIGNKDYDLSYKAAKIVGAAQGGGHIGKNPKIYKGINESASYEQSGMMIMIQPMIIEKSSPSMSSRGSMDRITFAGSGNVNSYNPVASRG